MRNHPKKRKTVIRVMFCTPSSSIPSTSTITPRFSTFSTFSSSTTSLQSIFGSSEGREKQKRTPNWKHRTGNTGKCKRRMMMKRTIEFGRHNYSYTIIYMYSHSPILPTSIFTTLIDAITFNRTFPHTLFTEFVPFCHEHSVKCDERTNRVIHFEGSCGILDCQ